MTLVCTSCYSASKSFCKWAREKITCHYQREKDMHGNERVFSRSESLEAPSPLTQLPCRVWRLSKPPLCCKLQSPLISIKTEKQKVVCSNYMCDALLSSIQGDIQPFTMFFLFCFVYLYVHIVKNKNRRDDFQVKYIALCGFISQC